jgi:hypothetical protein
VGRERTGKRPLFPGLTKWLRSFAMEPTANGRNPQLADIPAGERAKST